MIYCLQLRNLFILLWVVLCLVIINIPYEIVFKWSYIYIFIFAYNYILQFLKNLSTSSDACDSYLFLKQIIYVYLSIFDPITDVIKGCK